MQRNKTANFFHDEALFGMEIGHGSLKVMQLAPLPDKLPGGQRYHPGILGYGFTAFDAASQKDGVIVQPEIVAKAAHELFDKHIVGEINTKRVAIAIPAYRIFTRSLQIPKLKHKELDDAVQLEAEQYIPVPLEQLYLDYDVIGETKNGTELLVVAAPQVIVDSYLDLARILGLETVMIEPTLSALGRLFSLDNQSDVPAIIINFGAVSSDISIFDKHILVTGTVQGGGEDFTKSIKDHLQISLDEAALIKTRYGLGVSKKQADIKRALEPTLEQIVKEIRRIMRYYDERYGADRPIGQVVTMGGGANMPGLNEYLIEALHIAVRRSEPWQYFDARGLRSPEPSDRPMYATAAGLALAKPKEAFRQ